MQLQWGLGELEEGSGRSSGLGFFFVSFFNFIDKKLTYITIYSMEYSMMV